MAQDPENIRCRFYSAPKDGNSDEQMEDAAAWNCETGRFGISDGASESIFAGEWAKVLTEAFIANAPKEATFGEWLFASQKLWLARMDGQSVPWYVEEKLRDGAFATFLGLSVEQPGKNGVRSWTALAVGDCCFFQIVDHKVKQAFPIESSKSFGTRPLLVRSTAHAGVQPTWASGTARSGEQFWMMTDALAQWFLRQTEAGKKPWLELAGLSEGKFARWVDMLRKSRQIQNDDVSLLRIDLVDPVV